MITPEFLSYELDILKVHNEFEESVLRDIVRRIKKAGYVTDTAAYQAEVLQEAGLVYNDIIKEVAKQTKASEDEIKKIFSDAETEVFNYSEELILSAGYDVKAFKSISPGVTVWKKVTAISKWYEGSTYNEEPTLSEI